MTLLVEAGTVGGDRAVGAIRDVIEIKRDVANSARRAVVSGTSIALLEVVARSILAAESGAVLAAV